MVPVTTTTDAAASRRRGSARPVRLRFAVPFALVLLVAFSAVVLVVPALAADTGLTAEQEALAKRIEKRLIAPCCWVQPVDQHQSEIADSIKAQIRQFIAAGQTEQQILDTFVQQYGEKILASPKASGFNLLAWVLPAILVLAATAALIYGLFRWRRAGEEGDAGAALAGPQSPAGATVSQSHEEDAIRQKLDEELKSFDD